MRRKLTWVVLFSAAEGTVEANTIAVQTIPVGATRRIDAADPGNCRF
jgi:hypothetical protein